jgi:hypothetical protein
MLIGYSIRRKKEQALQTPHYLLIDAQQTKKQKELTRKQVSLAQKIEVVKIWQ